MHNLDRGLRNSSKPNLQNTLRSMSDARCEERGGHAANPQICCCKNARDACQACGALIKLCLTLWTPGCEARPSSALRPGLNSSGNTGRSRSTAAWRPISRTAASSAAWRTVAVPQAASASAGLLPSSSDSRSGGRLTGRLSLAPSAAGARHPYASSASVSSRRVCWHGREGVSVRYGVSGSLWH